MVSLRISAPPGKASEARRESQVEGRRPAGGAWGRLVTLTTPINGQEYVVE